MEFLRVDTTPHGVETPAHQLIANWLVFIYKTNASRGGYCPIPVSEVSRFYKTPTTQGRKRIPHGSIPPRKVETPTPLANCGLAGAHGAGARR